MLINKYLVTVIVLCCATVILCNPTERNVNEGRGFGSTLWAWITYPFSWWSSGETSPTSETLVATTRGPYDYVIVGKRNDTIMCNDHTCININCDDNGCTNVTCNRYDTDFQGKCRAYNQDPNLQDKPIQSTVKYPVTEESVTEQKIKDDDVEIPTELEAAISSTIDEKVPLILPAPVYTTSTTKNEALPQNKI